MNNKIKYIFPALIILLIFSACTKNNLDDLTGMYKAPDDYDLSSLVSETVDISGNHNVFTVELATSGVSGAEGVYSGTGEVLCLKFIGSKYYLESNGFTPASSSSAVDGNYITGNEGSMFYKVSSGTASSIQISSGTITVVKSDSVYRFSGALWLADGSIIRFNNTHDITYKKIVNVVTLTKVLSASTNDGIYTLQLATSGVSSYFDMSTYKTVYTGTGYLLSMQFIGSGLIAGSYTGAAKNSAEDGNYINGFLNDTYASYGVTYPDGSLIYTVTDGNAAAAYIGNGTATVTLNEDGTTTLYLDQDSNAYTFTGNLL
ncbi:MAG: hypothetical protein LKI59_07720 [Bacteroidales bacterium]|jgi:hypothetical protein|nr:hypothetical protein [Bacteroidales bacterium]